MSMDIDPQFKTPEGSQLRIYRDASQNNYLSQKQGRPVFDECIFVEVIAPGSSGSFPVFEVERTFAEGMNYEGALIGSKYAEYRQYIESFKNDETIDASLAGTPLKEWPEISRTMLATLRAQQIYTVDALASLSDNNLIAVGPDGRTWREKAQAYLAAAKDASFATELAAKLQQSEDQRTELSEQNKQLSDRLTALEAKLAEQSLSAPAKTAKNAAPAAPLDAAPGSIV